MVILPWGLSLGAGAADAGTRVAIKQTNVHGLILTGIGLLIGVPFYLFLLLICGFPVVGPGFWPVIRLHVPLFALLTIFTVEAHRRGEMLKVVPFAAILPVFLLVTSPFMGTGTPSSLGALGVLMVVGGLYILNVEPGQENLLRPFRVMLKDRGVQFMLAAQLCGAFTANLDLKALQNVGKSWEMYLFIDHMLVGLIILALIPIYIWTGKLVIRKKNEDGSTTISRLSFSDIKKDLCKKETYSALLSYGVLTVLATVLTMVGLQMLSHVPYLFAAKRAGAILFAVAFGIFMNLRESWKKIPVADQKFSNEMKNLGWKLSGIAIVVVGMVIVMSEYSKI